MKYPAASGTFPAWFVLVFGLFSGNTIQDSKSQQPALQPAGRLIPAASTMVTAWDIPRDPLSDPRPGDTVRSDQIRRGFRLFMKTHAEAPEFAPNGLSCGNCHLNGGQRERALPVVGVAGAFPEYNKREGRSFTLEDRIVGCFMRSENGTGTARAAGGADPAGKEGPYPSPESEEVAALASYIRWLSDGIPAGVKLPWRGQNTIHADSLIPVDKLDSARGRTLFNDHCVTCHGDDGQGVQIGDKKAGPLWGPVSWNDGAGAARIYTLAGFIRYAMPYLNPGSLSDDEAQQIAAFINSMSRPVYPLKHLDYRKDRIPPDAVYYRAEQR